MVKFVGRLKGIGCSSMVTISSDVVTVANGESCRVFGETNLPIFLEDKVIIVKCLIVKLI